MGSALRAHLSARPSRVSAARVPMPADELLERPPAQRLVRHVLRSRVAESLAAPHYAAMMRMAAGTSADGAARTLRTLSIGFS